MPTTATVQIAMPEMGESVTEGIVLEWHVAEGDAVKEGDTVVEVSTDKVDAEVPAPMDGVITKIVAQVDDEVPVGAPLAEMEPGDGEGQSARPAGPADAGDPPSPATAQETVPPTTSPTAEASEEKPAPTVAGEQPAAEDAQPSEEQPPPPPEESAKAADTEEKAEEGK